MPTQVTATVIDGTLKLNQPVDLPSNSRVRVTVEPLAESDELSDEERRAAWERFKQRARERPVNSGGLHFTRDELHERH